MSQVIGGRSIGDALAEATADLRVAGAGTPRLDAEVLLAHVLTVDRAHLLTHSADQMAPADHRAFAGLLARRRRGEPVAYLTGQRAWFDLTLRVTPDVLVPRPETEGLLEGALSWARDHVVQAVADVGTGSGALAIALARALPRAAVYATDVSAEALDVARANAAAAGVTALTHIVHERDGAATGIAGFRLPGDFNRRRVPLRRRVQFPGDFNRRRVPHAPMVVLAQGDLLAPLPGPVDLIVANLPYVGADEFASLPRDVRLYEPRHALLGGEIGHELIARLLADAPPYLRPGGAIMLEIGPAQARGAQAAARAAFPAAEIRVEYDYAGLERYLLVHSQ